jgi:hypothetical protein
MAGLIFAHFAIKATACGPRYQPINELAHKLCKFAKCSEVDDEQLKHLHSTGITVSIHRLDEKKGRGLNHEYLFNQSRASF